MVGVSKHVREVLTGSMFLSMTCSQVLANSLSGSEWRPTWIGQALFPVNTTIYLQFKGEGKLAGLGGCNHFFGTYQIAEPTITLSVVEATRKTCSSTVADLETAFLRVLHSTGSFERNRVVLSLFDRDGRKIATFVQADWD